MVITEKLRKKKLVSDIHPELTKIQLIAASVAVTDITAVAIPNSEHHANSLRKKKAAFGQLS